MVIRVGSIGLIVYGLVVACAPVAEAPPDFVYAEATREAQTAFLEQTSERIHTYVDNRVRLYGTKVDRVTPRVGRREIAVEMRCAMNPGWDCKAPHNVMTAQAERLETVCQIRRRYELDEHDIAVSWTERAKSGAQILMVRADLRTCQTESA